MAFRRSYRSVRARACALAVAAIWGLGGLQGHADAATASGAFAVRGTGAQSCKNITAIAAGDNADELVQLSAAWVAGYLSQYNRSAPNTYEAVPIVDNVVLGKLAINICRSNPDALFEAIAASLVASFSRGSLSEDSPMIEIKSDKNSAQVRRAVFRLVQQELINAGLLPLGSADGDYGPATRSALSKFQEARGITTTGVPDPQTLVHLFAMGEKARGASKN
ncbi:hypothetical protein ATER59S_00977 [Aquamicrobium terrae]